MKLSNPLPGGAGDGRSRGDLGGAEPRRHRFRAMGTQVELIAGGGSASAFRRAAAEIEETFDREERRFSRFLPDSELSRLNATAGAWMKVSAPFARVLDLALGAAEETGGLFDPTVLPALAAAGYDRDFEELGPDDAPPPAPPTSCGRWREVARRGTWVRLPDGASLDLGGVAKGWTVDLAAEATAETSDTDWLLVNAGGDLRLLGAAPRGLDVGVDAPETDGEAAHVRLDAGALATSCTSRRAWGPGLHHLIDPRTSLPATTGIVQATVWAATCAEAEIRSKEALLTGPAILRRVPALLVQDDGGIVTNLAPRRADVVA